MAVTSDATRMPTSTAARRRGIRVRRVAPSQTATASPARPPAASSTMAIAPASMRAPHEVVHTPPCGQNAASPIPQAMLAVR